MKKICNPNRTVLESLTTERKFINLYYPCSLGGVLLKLREINVKITDLQAENRSSPITLVHWSTHAATSSCTISKGMS